MDTEEKILTAIMLTPLLMGIVCIFLILCYKDVSVNCYKIVSIGGCDKYADCRVILENGEARFANYPAIGLTSCKTGHRWIWSGHGKD